MKTARALALLWCVSDEMNQKLTVSPQDDSDDEYYMEEQYAEIPATAV
jgi:hypothetical protein